MTSRFNSLQLFIEDVSCQNMYIRLVNRVLGDVGRISTVFPLGGRKEVIEACRSRRGPKELYVIDGDLDLLIGSPAPALPGLYRLQVYCAENLLIDENAVLQLAVEAAPSVPMFQMYGLLNFSGRIQGFAERLIPLFVVYAVVQALNLRGVQTVGFALVRLCNNHDPDSLSQRRIRARAKALIREIVRKTSWADYHRARRVITTNLRAFANPLDHLISGKTYLLPFVAMILRHHTGLHENVDSLKVRLAQHCELGTDPGFAAALIAAASYSDA